MTHHAIDRSAPSIALHAAWADHADRQRAARTRRLGLAGIRRRGGW